MEKRIVFLPVTFEVDTSRDMIYESVGLTAKEVSEFFKEIYIRSEKEDRRSDLVDYLLELIATGEVDSRILIFLSIHGFKKLWRDYFPGMEMLLRCQDEEEG